MSSGRIEGEGRLSSSRSEPADEFVSADMVAARGGDLADHADAKLMKLNKKSQPGILVSSGRWK
jgi:hypothetical protein